MGPQFEFEGLRIIITDYKSVISKAVVFGIKGRLSNLKIEPV